MATENFYEGLTKDSSNRERLNAFFKALQKSYYPVYVDCHLLGMTNFNNEQAAFEASLTETGFVELVDENPNEQNKFKLKPKGFAMLAEHGSYLNYLESKKPKVHNHFIIQIDENMKKSIEAAKMLRNSSENKEMISEVRRSAELTSDFPKFLAKKSATTVNHITNNHYGNIVQGNSNTVAGRDIKNEESPESKKLGKKNYRLALIIGIVTIIAMIAIAVYQSKNH
ncbi:MAG TPA: hypothetical protein VK718_01910 [Ferruginibacter sp.]|jgi:hypothetical protein|nr:hypothetical protein [Ferruginibacter sp.]